MLDNKSQEERTTTFKTLLLHRSHSTMTYFYTRAALIRFSGFVFFFLFLACYWQNEALIGETNGLEPAGSYLNRLADAYPHPLARFQQDDRASSVFDISPWCEVSPSDWFFRPDRSSMSSSSSSSSVVEFFRTLWSVIENGKLPHYSFQRWLGSPLDRASCFLHRVFLTPARRDTRGLPSFAAFKAAPTLLWWVSTADPFYFDAALTGIAVVGMVLSAFLMLAGRGSCAFFFIYALYSSVVSIGQSGFRFGWENQALETAFLLGLLDVGGLFFLRILLMKVLLGAGLIKLRGDRCWRDLTCMYYHYETQPCVNPLSIYFHSLPRAWHRMEVLFNHFVEICVPPLLLFPNGISAFAGACSLLFMTTITMSGNLASLNFITMIPAVAALRDEEFIALLKCVGMRSWAARLEVKLDANIRMQQEQQEQQQQLWRRARSFCRVFLQLIVSLVLLSLNLPALENLLALSQQQRMNMPHSWTSIAGSYGAFGSVTRDRPEVIFQVFSGQEHQTTSWHTLEIQHKFSGNSSFVFSPKVIAPYHARANWLAWFAGFMGIQQATWFHFMFQALRFSPADRKTLSVILEPSSMELLGRIAAATSPRNRRIRVQRIKFRFNVRKHRGDYDLVPLLDLLRRNVPSIARPVVNWIAMSLYDAAHAERTVKAGTEHMMFVPEDDQVENLVTPTGIGMDHLQSAVDSIIGKTASSSSKR